MADHKIHGDAEGHGEVEGDLGEAKSPKPKPGALVEDETLGGLTSGGVAPKDPSGHVTEGEATDPRERPAD